MTEDEKAATEWANKRCPEQGPEFIVWCMCRDDFLAGVEHGRKTRRVIKDLSHTISFTDDEEPKV
jgi:hypothetical protein